MKPAIRLQGPRDLLRNKYLYMLTIPAVLFSIIFAYLPLIGISIAFQDFNPLKEYFIANGSDSAISNSSSEARTGLSSPGIRWSSISCSS